MADSNTLTDLFFRDLKSFNSTNYAAIRKADLSNASDLNVNKAFSSVVTRYFIFTDKHPELSESEKRALYFILKIDLIAKYFSEYPDHASIDTLCEFQAQLIDYNNRMACAS